MIEAEKPDDIPQRLWDYARDAFYAAWDAHNELFNPASNSISNGLANRFIEASARSLLAAEQRERQACVEVGEILIQQISPSVNYTRIRHETITDMQTAIRNRGTEND